MTIHVAMTPFNASHLMKYENIDFLYSTLNQKIITFNLRINSHCQCITAAYMHRLEMHKLCCDAYIRFELYHAKIANFMYF